VISRVYVRSLGEIDTAEWFEVITRTPDRPRTAQRVADADLSATLAALPDDLAADALAQRDALRTVRPAIVTPAGTIPIAPASVMGIVNATPDSFSDGGAHLEAADARAHAAAMRAAGAAIIDVGGESTRPGAAPVAVAEELRRVMPAIERIASDGGMVSIDTRRSEVMTAGLAAGAAIINDVSALRHDPRSLEVVAASGAPVVLMHAPGEGDLHAGAGYRDVVLDVFDFLRERRDAAIAGGVAADRIILDPGIGFGKSLADNLALLRGLPLLRALGCPLLVGASRKRMVAAIAGAAPPSERLGGSLALALAALDGGAQILRVHDVAETVQAAAVWAALRS
jgi:dihydropteroate synthase